MSSCPSSSTWGRFALSSFPALIGTITASVLTASPTCVSTSAVASAIGWKMCGFAQGGSSSVKSDTRTHVVVEDVVDRQVEGVDDRAS